MSKVKSKLGYVDGKVGTLINWEPIYDLVGKLLTYIDATYTDEKQRKAHKSIVKQTIYGWYNNLVDSEPLVEYKKFTDGPNETLKEEVKIADRSILNVPESTGYDYPITEEQMS